MDDPDLDGLLAEAGKRPVLPSAAFLARIEADALREQPRAVPKPVAPAQGGGWAAGLWDLFGGRGGVAGLTRQPERRRGARRSGGEPPVRGGPAFVMLRRCRLFPQAGRLAAAA